ncbi:MAG: hypothetical protein IJM40_05560, partial [Synergistaceae bacterium]|nr:hypothetical protein [Synergistaceae bacterium]
MRYRSLSYNALDNAWKTKGFFKAVENLAKGSDDIFPTEFRNLFGDYYVSCYQYGACYDAYISITTETSEQVKEVENKLTAELSLLTPAPTSKIRLKILCRKAKATVTIKIVTNGLDFKAPKVAVITSADIASGYDKATAQIGDSLTQFIQAVNS